MRTLTCSLFFLLFSAFGGRLAEGSNLRTAPELASSAAAKVTADEICQMRVFDEALVPIGIPNSEQNLALGLALRAYQKRTIPDDFSSPTKFLEDHPQSPWHASLLTGLGLEYYQAAYYSRALEAWREAWELGQKATNVQGKFLADRAVCELAGLYSRLGRMNELEALLKSIEGRVFIGGAVERINLAREALWMMQYRPGVSFRCGPLALLSVQRCLKPQEAADKAIFESASSQKGFSLPQVAELSKKIGLNYQMAFRQPLTPSLPDAGREEKSGERRNAFTTASLSNSLPTRASRGEGENYARQSSVTAQEKGEENFVIPSVVHWKVGHYAALVRKEGDRYLLEDPTFGNTVWATREALEAETSGYFLIPPGKLPMGWRTVDGEEGGAIWGKGVTGGNDPDVYTPDDQQTGTCSGPGIESALGQIPNRGNPWGFQFGGGGVHPGSGKGMAVSSVHLMLANLQVRDTPVGYAPPVGPPVHFTVRYNHRDYIYRPAAGNVSMNLGPRWTHDWDGRIRDNPNSPLADVKYYVGGGGARTFTGFNSTNQTFAPQQYDHTRLIRVGTNAASSTYEMLYPDGSKKIFGSRAGVDVRLTQVMDAAGNAVTLTYESPHQNIERLAALTDAIGQVTTISYEHPENPHLITRVTDPFGRSAFFQYRAQLVLINPVPQTFATIHYLTNITDVAGMSSWLGYTGVGSTDQMLSLITPYGTNRFLVGQGPSTNATMRFVETIYPDGSRERVEFNQSDDVGIPNSEPASAVPQGMSTQNSFHYARNTYYWSRIACATAYGDYKKARIYHWLHAANLTTTAGIIESIKEPLERRVWYDYDGQPGPYGVGTTDQPRHIGRVLDDGTTQLYTYSYNRIGNITNTVDPLGRRFSYVYDSNGVDLVEVRQTRSGNNDLLFRAIYNEQHRPLALVNAAGQTNSYTYNTRGQLLTETNPKGEITTYTYDLNGYLIGLDGPLAGTNDLVSATYDAFGRLRSVTGVTGYKVFYDYDALDRLVRITYPDSTFTQYTYDRLDLVHIRDRDGEATAFEYDSVGQVRKETDRSGRVTLFSWCRCGGIQSLIDPMGRTTEWQMDVQGRMIGKRYSDGSTVSYVYEDTTSRLRQVIDEKQQVRQYVYNRDDTLKAIAFANNSTPAPVVTYTYDTNYDRITSVIDDGVGITSYSYQPITDPPTLGAGRLVGVDGPLQGDSIRYGYDALGRPVTTTINGATSTVGYDALNRVVGETNALGGFTYGYENASRRPVSFALPNQQTEERSYSNGPEDRLLQRITHRLNTTPISEFVYGHDAAASRITSWSQQVGSSAPDVHQFGYDDADQLLSTTVTRAGSQTSAFAYAYDAVGNRLSEQIGASESTATHNALNQISTRSGSGLPRTNEWDTEDRLMAVTVGNRRTEFTYDGYGRRIGIRQLVDGSEVSDRRFVWCGPRISEERSAGGAVLKRFFRHGVKIEAGPVTGSFYYTRDHLGSIREITDANGVVRARYTYDPFGRRTKLSGDVDADFGFAGMFWSAEVNLSLTLFRAYDPELGRWLSRDPLESAELTEGPNLYAYVGNNPINAIDPLGLSEYSVSGLWPDDIMDWWIKTYGPGEIEEVDDFVLRPAPKRSGGDLALRGKGDIMVRPKGELMVRPKLTVERWTPRVRQPYAAPPMRARPPSVRIPSPGPPTRFTGPSGAFGAIFDSGMTILTMANCDTVEGIFAIMRVRRGELLNKYENEMMKAIEKDLW